MLYRIINGRIIFFTVTISVCKATTEATSTAKLQQSFIAVLYPY